MENNNTDILQTLIKEILLLPTFSFQKFDAERRLKIDKVGIDINDIHRLLNQFKGVKKKIDMRMT